MGSPCLAGAVILGRVVMKWTRVFPGLGGLEEEKRACHQGLDELSMPFTHRLDR